MKGRREIISLIVERPVEIQMLPHASVFLNIN